MLSLYKITIIIFVINIVLISYTSYVFFFKLNNYSDLKTHSIDVESVETLNSKSLIYSDLLNSDKSEASVTTNTDSRNQTNLISVEIWSKAAIGFYLWEHILNAKIDKRVNSNLYFYGFKKLFNYKFKFRSGPVLSINSLEQMKERNLVLVLNGRDKEKVGLSIDWLKAVSYKVREHDLNVGLIVLGDEQCHNSWLNPYLVSNGGAVKFVFIVYDWKQIDDRVIYQWPLGVATYRNFPNPDFSKLNLQMMRPYVCNFIATIYPDSSRQELLHVLEKDEYKNLCIIRPRHEWQPKETRESLNLYVEALRLSDLTLSPIGMNHECYRIFEAMAFGSVPVIEKDLSHVMKSSCDRNNVFRLLKQNNGPFIYVTNWTNELPIILQNEQTLSLEFKIQRRIELIKWYQTFKITIRNRFIDLLNENFA